MGRTPVNVDMPDRSVIKEFSPQRVEQFAARESNIRIVCARHHHAAKWQGRSRNWRKSTNSFGRDGGGLDIRRSGQQGALTARRGTYCRDMRHEGATMPIAKPAGIDHKRRAQPSAPGTQAVL
jgi:hypothetical protein